MISRSIVFAAALSLVSVVAPAYSQSAASSGIDAPAAGSVPAVSYGTRRGSTRLIFKGTAAMPAATGEARVEAQRGSTKIQASFTDLQNPTVLGHEYLTYIMWAVSPDGRAVNLGEILLPGERTAFTSFLPGSRSTLNATTTLQTFALVITAEPYYVVRDPSTLVVMENFIPADSGPVTTVDTRYNFAGSGGYVPTGFRFDPILLRTKLPLDFFQARNAVRIAQSSGAEQHAAAIYANAVSQLGRAEDLAGQKKIDKRALTAASREAVQTAEDARAIAAPRVEALRTEAERKAIASREAEARAVAQAELERRLKAEGARASAAEADRAAAEAARSAAQTERIAADRQRAEAEAARIAAQTERLAAERQREEATRASRDAVAATEQARKAQAEAEQRGAAAQRAQAEAEERRAAALQQQQVAEAESARNRATAAELDQKLQQALHDREDLRASLLQQLSVILETRDTARGLVVNLSDVTFATGQATLQPGAREKLARVSGILAAHPTLRLEIEGHTDSVGSDTSNQALSEKRAEAVRGYLIQQGVPAASTTATGFGKARPVASNDTATGRQVNRRVELVVSGDVIGTQAQR